MAGRQSIGWWLVVAMLLLAARELSKRALGYGPY